MRCRQTVQAGGRCLRQTRNARSRYCWQHAQSGGNNGPRKGPKLKATPVAAATLAGAAGAVGAQSDWLIYLVPDQSPLISIVPKWKNSYIKKWGGYHATIGKTIATTAGHAQALVNLLSSQGKTKKWILGTSAGRQASLGKWPSAGGKQLWVVTFVSGSLDKAAKKLKHNGWGRTENEWHVSLGYTHEITYHQAAALFAALQGVKNWNWVAAQKQADGTTKWIYSAIAYDL